MIVYFVLSVLVIAAYKLWVTFKCPKELENLPSAPFWSYLYILLSKNGYNGKIKQQIQPLLDKYGVIRIYDYMGWSVLVGDPKIGKEIFAKPEIFGKPDWTQYTTSEIVAEFFGASSVLDTNGQEWKRHRKIINPIFNKSWSTELFGSCVQDLINQWEKMDGMEVKVHDQIQRMTLDVLGKAIFDMDFKAVKEANSYLYNLYHDIMERIMEPAYVIFGFLESIPFTRRSKLANDVKEYNDFVDSVVKTRKEEMEDHMNNHNDNLINALIESNDNTDEHKLTNDEIRNNIKIFILAGHDTTSNTLTSTLYYLSRYPEIQDKLRKEVLQAMDNPIEVIIPTIDQLKNIPYMDLVNKESMRIMTTVTQVERACIENHTLSNGITIPKNTQVIVNIWGIHHNSTVYKNPEEFIPDRFKDLSSEESRSWQPFTTGTRSCIGTTFSMMEQRVAIAMLLQKFEFSIGNDNPDYQKLRLSPISLIRPSDLNITIKVRQ